MAKSNDEGLLSTGELSDIVRITNKNVHPNNRGVNRIGNRYIPYGFPPPKKGEGKDENALRGGDFIGYTQVVITPDMVGQTIAVFTNIEVKGAGDRAKEGQVRFHNLILDRGGISKIYKANGQVIKCKTTKKEVNKK